MFKLPMSLHQLFAQFFPRPLLLHGVSEHVNGRMCEQIYASITNYLPVSDKSDGKLKTRSHRSVSPHSFYTYPALLINVHANTSTVTGDGQP